MKNLITSLLALTIFCISTAASARGGHGGGHSTRSPSTHVSTQHSHTAVSAPKASTPKASTPKVSAPTATVTHVKPYVKPSTGAVVQGHNRAAPNKTQKDNWSSKPNVNPETGKAGTKAPKK